MLSKTYIGSFFNLRSLCFDSPPRAVSLKVLTPALTKASEMKKPPENCFSGGLKARDRVA